MKNKLGQTAKEDSTPGSVCFIFCAHKIKKKQRGRWRSSSSQGNITRGDEGRHDISSVGICGGFKRSPLWAINAAVRKQKPDPLDKHYRSAPVPKNGKVKETGRCRPKETGRTLRQVRVSFPFLTDQTRQKGAAKRLSRETTFRGAN